MYRLPVRCLRTNLLPELTQLTPYHHEYATTVQSVRILEKGKRTVRDD